MVVEVTGLIGAIDWLWNIWFMKVLNALLSLFLCLASGLLPAVFALGMWGIAEELQCYAALLPQSSLQPFLDVIPTICNLLLMISPIAGFAFIRRRNWLALVTCGFAVAVAFGLEHFSWPPNAYHSLSHLVSAIAILNAIAFFASLYHEGMGRGDEPGLQQLGCGKHATLNQPPILETTPEAEDRGITITIPDRVEQLQQ